ncbi:MAG: radical SAM protein [Candidatus Nealsonbacteria bacterium]
MKVLFITKDFIIEPLGIMYVAGALKKAGHEADIVKSGVENAEKKVKDFAPDIIAYSLTTGQHGYFLDLNRKLKSRFKFLAVFGGSHPTFFTEIIKNEGVDVICIGEGEEAFTELADKMSRSEDFSAISNLWVKKGGEIIKNDVRSLSDIDSLAFPSRELVYAKYSKSCNNPIKNFLGGRGCPFNCPYCFNHSLKAIYRGRGQYVRFRSVDNLLQEILEVKNKYPMKMIYFQDDTFGTKEEWLEEFSEKYPKMINLPFHCHARANLINEKLTGLLKKAGCSGVTFGIESGNDRLRNQLLERNMTKDQIIKAAKLVKKAGLRLRIFNMLGLPEGSLKDDFETLELNILCQPDLGWASIYQPYPRTKLGDLCIQKGIYGGDIDKISETFFEESVLDIKDKAKINNLQKLFSLAVSFPVLFPLVKVLINLPPNGLFRKTYAYWKEKLNRRIYHI